MKRLEGTNVKNGKTKRELAELLRQDIRDFKAKNNCEPARDRVVRLHRDLHRAGAAHQTLEAFETAMETNDVTIAPSMLYA